jgi:hypothetical protein
MKDLTTTDGNDSASDSHVGRFRLFGLLFKHLDRPGEPQSLFGR